MIFKASAIADEVAKEFGLGVSKMIPRRLVAHNLRYMIKVVKSKNGDRLMLRNNDIHTAYRETPVKELCGKLADLDETKIITREKNFAVKNPGFKNPRKHQKKFAKRIWQYKIPKLNA